MAAGDWVTYYDTATGEIRGCGTVPPESIPPGISTVNHGTLRPDIGNRWNAATRAWVAIPPEVLVDRLQDLLAHPYVADMWTRLTVTQRLKLRRILVWTLAGRRWRQQSEEVAIDPPASWPADPANAVE